MGLANQLASFVLNLAHCTTNLRKMTSTKNAFTWQDPHEAYFILMKKLFTSPLVVKPFNTKAHTILLMDASRLHRLGFALIQKPDNLINSVLSFCGSKSLTETQANHATVELEAFVILYTFQKCNFYLRGLPQFEVQTDQKPLEGVFKRQMHSMDNAHLLRIREKMARYNFTVRLTPGKTKIIANTLSRAPIFDPEEEELTASSTLQCLAATREPERLTEHNC